jgi:hypothetical protein
LLDREVRLILVALKQTSNGCPFIHVVFLGTEYDKLIILSILNQNVFAVDGLITFAGIITIYNHQSLHSSAEYFTVSVPLLIAKGNFSAVATVFEYTGHCFAFIHSFST